MSKVNRELKEKKDDTKQKIETIKMHTSERLKVKEQK